MNESQERYCTCRIIPFKAILFLLKFRDLKENPIYSAGCVLLNTSGHYRSKPTSGFGEECISANGAPTFAEIFLEIFQSNPRDGVRLSHTEEEIKQNFRSHPDLEKLSAKLNKLLQTFLMPTLVIVSAKEKPSRRSELNRRHGPLDMKFRQPKKLSPLCGMTVPATFHHYL
uniref:Uncharacterized protein n=1 Tax=Spermophilus dauricus TaxID=99837 RepID=A0A8C9QH93_SPEDA